MGSSTCAAELSELLQLSREHGLSLGDERFAELLDERDPMKWLRSEFHVPKISEIIEDDSDYEGTYSYVYPIAKV